MRIHFSEESEEGPDLTPIIDVVFLLLIFFLVATTFEQEEKVASLNLAEILKARPVAAGTRDVIVNITKDGEYVISGETLQEPALVELIHQVGVKNPGTQIQIRADQDVRFKFPLTVIGICKIEDMDYSCTVLESEQE
ncbi:MAG: biopolymer transport protein ExbD [Pirellulaceae bacterium]|jgi:biopolymer transport protein ExbD